MSMSTNPSETPSEKAATANESDTGNPLNESDSPEGAVPVVLPPETMEVLEEAGVDTRDSEKVTRIVAAVTASISRSPFPSADMLREYDQFRSGFADEIIGWIKQQTAHRQGLETIRTTGSETRQNNAQRNAVGLAIFGVIAATIIALAGGSVWIGAVIAIACVGGPSAATVLARFIPPQK